MARETTHTHTHTAKHQLSFPTKANHNGLLRNLFNFIRSRILPALLPVFLLFTINHGIYSGMQHLNYLMVNAGYPSFKPSIPGDYMLPELSGAGNLYVLAIVYFIVGPILVYAVMGKHVFYRFVLLSIYVDVTAYLLLFFFPTVDNLTATTNTKILPPDMYCCMPSFHVIFTYLPFVASRQIPDGGKRKGRHKVFICFSLIYALSIPPITGLVKEHYMLDCVASIALCELMLIFINKIIKNKGAINIECLFTSLNILSITEPMIKPYYSGATFSQKYAHKKIVIIIIQFILLILYALGLGSFVFGN